MGVGLRQTFVDWLLGGDNSEVAVASAERTARCVGDLIKVRAFGGF
jgi:hypothetical protein